MEIIEKFAPGDWRGEVEILAEDTETGEVWSCGRNTITLKARKIMAALLGPKMLADVKPVDTGVTERILVPDLSYLIKEIVWGSGSKATDRSDEALDNFVFPTPVAYPVSFDDTSVTFQSSINPGDGPDDQEYSEVGLRAANGLMFARYVFPSIRKFRRLRLSVRWQIFFA